MIISFMRTFWMGNMEDNLDKNRKASLDALGNAIIMSGIFLSRGKKQRFLITESFKSKLLLYSRPFIPQSCS